LPTNSFERGVIPKKEKFLDQENSQLLQQILSLIYAAFTRVKDIWIPASGLRAPGLKPASYVSHGISGVWEFSDEGTANEETISGNVKLRDDMDLTVAPTFLIGWSSTTTSSDCYWQLEYLYTALNEDTSAAAQQTLLEATTSSAVAEGLNITTFTLQAPSAGDQCLHMRIKRKSGDALDTIADTVELHGVCLQYQADIIGAS